MTEYSHKQLFPNSNSGDPFEKSESIQLCNSMWLSAQLRCQAQCLCEGRTPWYFEEHDTQMLTPLLALQAPLLILLSNLFSICLAFNHAHSFPAVLGDTSHTSQT